MTRRWRRWLWAYLVVCAVFVGSSTWQDAAGIVARHIRVDSNGALVSTDNLLAGSALKPVVAAAYVTFCLSCVGRQIAGYRHSAGVYRQQLKWLLSGGAISLGGLVVAMTVGNSHVPVLHALGFIGFVSVAALPVGIGIGILKYRLYEIDRLISRTLSYLVLTGLLVGLFFAIVVVGTDVLPFSSPVAVAGSTLAAAALFNPLRQRVQRLVDRRFNRTRYDAEATVAAFSARLRNAVDLETVEAGLVDAVNQAIAPTHAAVWIRSTDGPRA